MNPSSSSSSSLPTPPSPVAVVTSSRKFEEALASLPIQTQDKVRAKLSKIKAAIGHGNAADHVATLRHLHAAVEQEAQRQLQRRVMEEQAAIQESRRKERLMQVQHALNTQRHHHQVINTQSTQQQAVQQSLQQQINQQKTIQQHQQTEQLQQAIQHMQQDSLQRQIIQQQQQQQQLTIHQLQQQHQQQNLAMLQDQTTAMQQNLAFFVNKMHDGHRTPSLTPPLSSVASPNIRQKITRYPSMPADLTRTLSARAVDLPGQQPALPSSAEVQQRVIAAPILSSKKLPARPSTGNDGLVKQGNSVRQVTASQPLVPALSPRANASQIGRPSTGAEDKQKGVASKKRNGSKRTAPTQPSILTPQPAVPTTTNPPSSAPTPSANPFHFTKTHITLLLKQSNIAALTSSPLSSLTRHILHHCDIRIKGLLLQNRFNYRKIFGPVLQDKEKEWLQDSQKMTLQRIAEVQEAIKKEGTDYETAEVIKAINTGFDGVAQLVGQLKEEECQVVVNELKKEFGGSFIDVADGVGEVMVKARINTLRPITQPSTSRQPSFPVPLPGEAMGQPARPPSITTEQHRPRLSNEAPRPTAMSQRMPPIPPPVPALQEPALSQIHEPSADSAPASVGILTSLPAISASSASPIPTSTTTLDLFIKSHVILLRKQQCLLNLLKTPNLSTIKRLIIHYHIILVDGMCVMNRESFRQCFGPVLEDQENQWLRSCRIVSNERLEGIRGKIRIEQVAEVGEIEGIIRMGFENAERAVDRGNGGGQEAILEELRKTFAGPYIAGGFERNESMEAQAPESKPSTQFIIEPSIRNKRIFTDEKGVQITPIPVFRTSEKQLKDVITEMGLQYTSELQKSVMKGTLERLLNEVLERNEVLNEEVKEILLDTADDFINNITFSACNLANLRNSTSVSVEDMNFHLVRYMNLRAPGYSMDEFITIRGKPTRGHLKRAANVKKAIWNERVMGEVMRKSIVGKKNDAACMVANDLAEQCEIANDEDDKVVDVSDGEVTMEEDEKEQPDEDIGVNQG